ncbi:MAG: PAS domain-containing protein, partial [Pseudomonadota bacterium]
MQQQTTKELYAYWDHIRNRQIAPRRFQVEPAKIPQLLRETFIAECEHAHHVPFRLAGTQICHHFGRELRGTDLLELWTHEDRITLSSMIQNIIGDGAVVHGNFIAMTDTNREAIFEFVLLPLIHTGNDVNRILGAFTTIDQPFWL